MPRTLTSVHVLGRRLLIAVFATLLVVAVSFVGTFLYFNVLNQRVFSEFEGFTRSANINADISREMFGLELKIREMLSVVLSDPAKLARLEESLLVEFADIQEDVRGMDLPDSRKVFYALDKYRIALYGLLQGYAAVNDTLHSLNALYDAHTQSLTQLEETTAQLLVDVSLAGRDSTGLQQTYVLLPLCVEEFLHAHMLVRSSIADNAPGLLGVSSEAGGKPAARHTVLEHLEITEKTLSTMTSAQEPIGGAARQLLQRLSTYRTRIRELYGILVALREDSKTFAVTRDHVLDAMKGIDDRAAKGITRIRTLIGRHRHEESIAAFFISGAILAVSLLGMLVARQMSRSLEYTTQEAVDARAQQVIVNEQLEQEIQERRKIEGELLQARDSLETRVNERTAELSNANAQLEAEVAERLAAEKGLADERERLAVTLRSIGDGVISTDTEGRVTLLNQNAEKLTGWDQDDATGRPLHEIFRILHEITRQPCANPVEKVLATGGIIGLENHTVLIAKDGSERIIADSGAPIFNRDNIIIGVVLVFRDITEQVKQEEELFRAQKMESIGTLAGGIAHDFNNILSAIVGYTELAMMRTDPREPAHKDLNQIRQASDRAVDLVSQILTFSRRQPQQKVPLQLSLLIKETLKLLRAAIPTTIDIHQDIGSDATVMADATQMHQVIMNLCTNAYHAMMEQGGVLSVTLKEKVIVPTMIGFKSEELPPGRYVQLSVTDTGCGMEKAVMDRIFEPYFTTKEKGRGTGLGLAVVHGIVKSHDGRISVYSEPGRGTTVNVYLPIISREEPLEVIKPAPPMARAHERVMVVDDERAIRDIASQMLTHAGYEVTTYSNGMEAWEAYSRNPDEWDLILTDQTMPEMTGDQLAGRALEINPHIPIIICSGYSERLAGNWPKVTGIRAVLQKPVDKNTLLTQVAMALDTSANRDDETG